MTPLARSYWKNETYALKISKVRHSDLTWPKMLINPRLKHILNWRLSLIWKTVYWKLYVRFVLKGELLKFNYYVSIDENTECLCFLNSLMLELSELWGRCSIFPVWPCSLEWFSDFRWLILMVCLVPFWTARLLKINLTPVSCFLTLFFIYMDSWGIMGYLPGNVQAL